MHSLNMSKSAATQPASLKRGSYKSPASVPLQPTSTKVYSSASTKASSPKPAAKLRHV